MIYKICLILAIVGGLNWGLVGLFNFDLITWIFGSTTSIFARIVYCLIGISSVCSIPVLFMGNDRSCSRDIPKD